MLPTSANISVTPDPAVAGDDDLTCSVDVASTDTDGDAIVYNYIDDPAVRFSKRPPSLQYK